jgi:uncharacterized SAM-binding protein YcdF (DUF218 family)
MALSGDRKAIFGILSRRERWGLTLRGWVFCALCLATATIVCLVGVYPFLAPSKPVPADIVVAEGWLSPLACRRAAERIRADGYKKVFITGGPLEGIGGFDPEYGTLASQGFRRLRKVGLPESMLQPVPCRHVGRDRTYTSALALRNWLEEHNEHPSSINVISESVHARRSRLLAEKALGPNVRVGIIALPPSDYPAERWWKYSAGVKDIISEAVGYMYVRLFFWP